MIAFLLIAANGLFFAGRFHRTDGPLGTITHVGIDSLVVITPASEPAVTFREGRWELDGRPVADPRNQSMTRIWGEELVPVAFITLEPSPTYGNVIRALRDLKARNVCNVLIRDGGRPLESHDELEIPALVLCGRQLGDAGFSGTLAPDGPIRLTTS